MLFLTHCWKMSTAVKQLNTASFVSFFIRYILKLFSIVHLANVRHSNHTRLGPSWWRFDSPRQWHNHMSGLVQSYISAQTVSVGCVGCEGYSIYQQNIASGGQNDLLEGTNEWNIELWKWLMSFCVMKEDHSWLSRCKWMTSCVPYISVRHKWTKMKSCKFSHAIKKLNMAA